MIEALLDWFSDRLSDSDNQRDTIKLFKCSIITHSGVKMYKASMTEKEEEEFFFKHKKMHVINQI